MTAHFTTGMTADRCYMAGACTSATLVPLVDTALLLAVSICVVVRILLLLA